MGGRSGGQKSARKVGNPAFRGWCRWFGLTKSCSTQQTVVEAACWGKGPRPVQDNHIELLKVVADNWPLEWA